MFLRVVWFTPGGLCFCSDVGIKRNRKKTYEKHNTGQAHEWMPPVKRVEESLYQWIHQRSGTRRAERKNAKGYGTLSREVFRDYHENGEKNARWTETRDDAQCDEHDVEARSLGRQHQTSRAHNGAKNGERALSEKRAQFSRQWWEHTKTGHTQRADPSWKRNHRTC